METLNSTMFFPWVGDDYSTGGIFKKKILILGEAHYCETPENCGGCKPGARNGCNEFTIDRIREQFSPTGKKHAIYTKLAKLFLNCHESVNNDDKIRFWNSVAYYNYIQTSVSDQARVAPNSEMWNLSKKAFNDVMDYLKPDFLLILSYRLWDNLPGQAGIDWPVGPEIQINDSTEKTWIYKGAHKETLSYVICHPSSSHFNYGYIPIIEKAINLS